MIPGSITCSIYIYIYIGNDHVGKQFLVRSIRNDNPSNNFINQPLDIMIFMQNFKVIGLCSYTPSNTHTNFGYNH